MKFCRICTCFTSKVLRRPKWVSALALISGPRTNENAPIGHVVCKVQIVYKLLLERWE
jgi:hypothetical protein